MVKIFGGFFNKIHKSGTTTENKQTNSIRSENKTISDETMSSISQCQSSYGKALIKTPETKQEKLDKAGFTEDVINKLKKEGCFYGESLIDEVLEMAIFLDEQNNAGKPITKRLIEKAIDLFSPESSGGSASVQRSILATYWTQGDKIYAAYGQTPPIKTKEIKELSPEEKQMKLDKAGFTEDVIQNLKEKHTFYGSELIDEALNMAIYLDKQHDAGVKITKDLIDDTINAFSPYASGGSASAQLQILANNWTHGNLIKKVYK